MNHKTSIVKRGDNPDRIVITCSGCGIHLVTRNGMGHAKELAKQHEKENG